VRERLAGRLSRRSADPAVRNGLLAPAGNRDNRGVLRSGRSPHGVGSVAAGIALARGRWADGWSGECAVIGLSWGGVYGW